MFNEYPYTNYEKINLDWLLDLGKKLKEDAESGEFDGERGHGIFGITNIYAENGHYYAVNPGDVTVGDFIIGYGPAAGLNVLYIMKVTSVSGNYVNGTSIIRITGPQGEQGPQGEPGAGGLTEAIKQALLQLARKVAYIDGNGQTYYDALYTAFYGSAPVVVLDSITAAFTQGTATIYDTDSLDTLKQYLTVTATYSDSSTATVPSTDYTLSGTLAEGTSIITVRYGGQTTTFDVTVTHQNDTTAEIDTEGYVFIGNGNLKQEENGGTTIKYNLDAPTTVLHPAGIIPVLFSPVSLIGNLCIYKNDEFVNYVSEYESSSVGRWAQIASGELVEYSSKSWNVAEYNQISFSVDMRYIDDAYMYDYTSGQVFFAGKNTPYYGMSNVSEVEQS